MPRKFATTRRHFAVRPYLLFLFEEHGLYFGVTAVQFCFGKTKDVGTNRLHMVESIEDVDPVVGGAQSINILEIYSYDL